MSDRYQPSAWAMESAMSLLVQAADKLAQDAEFQGDQDLLADWLSSSPDTCDAFEVLPKLARGIIALEGQEKLAKERAAEIAERARRFGNRAEMLRQTLLDAMTALTLPRIRAPDFSVSIGKGRAKVLITDERALPDQFCRIERRPLLREIADALDGGADVPGATRSNVGPQLTIRKA